MGKSTFYALWTAIGLLFCLNAGLIGWLVWKTDRSPEPAGSLLAGPVRRWYGNPGDSGRLRSAIGQRVADRLGFSPKQRATYEQAQRQQEARLGPVEDSLRQGRATLFGRLGQLSPAEADALIRQMERQQGRIIQLRVAHWQRIRALCTPPQQSQFDTLLIRLSNRLESGGLRAGTANRFRYR